MDLSTALDAARAVDPARYAIAGRAPRTALRPTSADEVVEAVRAAAAEKRAIVPWGGGVSLARDAALERYDVALDLTGLDRIVEYDPEDFTLTAECGATIASLRSALGARRQELPLEGAHADRATLGGVLAANASGPRRLRFGAPHDRILGARFVLGDGTRARSGGKVVKNVAGYALHRLLCGSRGGLAILLETSLKVAPAPERRAAIIYDVTAEQLTDRKRWASLARLEPAALTVVGGAAIESLPKDARTGAAFQVIIGLEDDGPWVEEQRAHMIAALGEPAFALADDAVATLWQTLADVEEVGATLVSLTTADNSPAALAPCLGEDSILFHAHCGRLHLSAASAQATVARLAEAGFQTIAARGAAIMRPIPPQSAVLALRERIRAELDPGSTMALGPRWAAAAF